MSDAQTLDMAVRDLAAVVSRRGVLVDDEGETTPPGVRFAADLDALAALQRRREVPPVYAEFLRRYSSHDFVDAGLVCDGAAAWIVPVDTVAEVAACFEGPAFPGRWLVCATDHEGCYVLDTASVEDGDCPVLYLAHGSAGEPRRVAPTFVEFLRRVARESAEIHAPSTMTVRTASPPIVWLALALAAAAVVSFLVVFRC